MQDDLGNRMKGQYEDRTRYSLPRRTYTIIRLDGKAFHTFTRNMKRPYDENLMKIMDETAKFLCEEIQGAQFAYTQSDEISLLLTDFEKITTDAWFDGNIQKMVSVAASLATQEFNRRLLVNSFFEAEILSELPPLGIRKHLVDYLASVNLAAFDARIFTIPDHIEVENYFIWRQKDAVRNSISMAAQSLYSHKDLEGKSSPEKQDMIHDKGQNWNDMPDGFKRGRFVRYMSFGDFDDSNRRSVWEIIPAPDFLKDRNKLSDRIPLILE